MKLSQSALGLALASSVLASPVLLSADSQQPACAYPIGQSGGSNAKVAGRLFEIDGKVGYFAGMTDTDCNLYKLTSFREQCLVACTLEQEFRRGYYVETSCGCTSDSVVE
jgi:mannan endo-1,4-beta-mannosidase